MSRQSRYRKIARECYDRVLDEHDGRCTLDEVKDELAAEIRAQGISDDILQEFVEALAQSEDDARARRADSGQLDLLTGEPEVFEGIWRLGEGRRVQIKHATRVDVYATLGLRAENAARVAQAFASDQRRLGLLLPYMTDDTVTIPEARELWRHDQDGGDTAPADTG